LILITFKIIVTSTTLTRVLVTISLLSQDINNDIFLVFMSQKVIFLVG